MVHGSDKLIATTVKKAKPKERQYKLFDGKGLYLLVTPAGGKYWRLKYRFHDKEKVLALGVYPEVTLARARKKRFDARVLLSENKDPNLVKKEQLLQERIQASNTFEIVAREWLDLQKNNWTERHAERVLSSLEANIFPMLGDRPVAEITPIELLEVLRVIEHRGALDMAGRVLQRCHSIFQYAIVSQRAEINPAGALPGALRAPVRKNYAALSAKDLPDFLTKLEQFDCLPGTKLAIQLLILTFVRTGELRAARWDEFDLGGKQWRIPAERMKMGVEHIVPLSDQAIAVLKQLQELTGAYDLVFPGRVRAYKPMSNNTILFALYNMGYRNRATGHGFRTTASTVLNELGFDSDAIERQLAHGEKDKVRAAYNKAKYLDKRKEMMQAWADYVDSARGGKAAIVLIKRAAKTK